MTRALEPEEVAFDLEATYIELKARALEEGGRQITREQWEKLTEEILKDKMDYEVLDQGLDWTDCRQELESRYDEFSEEIAELA